MPLSKEFQTKHPLRFRKDGGFRILMMSDAHHKPDKGDRTIRAMEGLLPIHKRIFCQRPGFDDRGRSPGPGSKAVFGKQKTVPL